MVRSALASFCLAAALLYAAGAAAEEIRPSETKRIDIPADRTVSASIVVAQQGWVTLQAQEIGNVDCGILAEFPPGDFASKAVYESSVDYSETRFKESYFAKAGSYQLQFGCQIKNHDAVAVSFRYDLEPLVLPDASKPFVRWLDQAGLSRYFQVTDYKVVSAGASAPLPSVVAPQPRLTVFFHINETSEEWAPIRSKLNARLGEDYGTVLLSKASLFSHIPRRQILLEFAGNCWSEGYAEGPFVGRDYECKMKSSPFTLSDADEKALVKIHPLTAKTDVALPPADTDAALIDVFEKELDAYFKPRGGLITVLERDHNYLEIVVRGLRGAVVKNGSRWERLQIAINLAAVPGGYDARVQVDGALGSGWKRPKTDSGYDEDIERDYSGALADFAKELTVVLRQG